MKVATKNELIEGILSKIYKDTDSNWVCAISDQEWEFYRPLNVSLMQRFRITWDNDLNFRIEKSNYGRWVLQIFNTSRWFDVHDYLRIRYNDAIKYLKKH